MECLTSLRRFFQKSIILQNSPEKNLTRVRRKVGEKWSCSSFPVGMFSRGSLVFILCIVFTAADIHILFNIIKTNEIRWRELTPTRRKPTGERNLCSIFFSFVLFLPSPPSPVKGHNESLVLRDRATVTKKEHKKKRHVLCFFLGPFSPSRTVSGGLCCRT